MAIIESDEIRTLYYDKKEGHFVYIIMRGKVPDARVSTHKVPKDIYTEDAAHKYILERKL